MALRNNWKRRNFTTKGADPTEVVIWTHTHPITGHQYEVMEFQNIHTITSRDRDGKAYDLDDQELVHHLTEAAKALESFQHHSLMIDMHTIEESEPEGLTKF